MDAIKLIESLDPDGIRSRLESLEAEEKALRVLLRASIAHQRPATKPGRAQPTRDGGRAGR